ncbi:MAG: hypothetical protein IJ313_04320 [Clostridia bacterium]|nr:hypothetical protein [Clostridia bacterium]
MADKQQMTEMELKKWIADGICANHPEKKRDAVERTIRNWFTGKTRSISRETAFELCLIMRLSVDEANHFMMRTCDEAIHWRNPKEIAWGYALEHGLSYAQTQALIDAVQSISPEKKADTSADVFTHMIRAEVKESLQGTKEELLLFIREKQALWGSFHNEAYTLFKKYLNLLEMATPDRANYERQKEEQEEAKKKNKEAQIVVEEKMSVDSILNTYFFSRWLSGSTHGDSIHKSIRANWPDATVLSKMRNRSGGVDVSRKVLIMLFLATNGDETAYRNRDSESDEDEPKTREQVFRDVYKRLNLMLSRCGFQPLDPRSPFDWIVLYCICVEDVLETDQRLNDMLSGLFCEPEGKNED